tara:strand:- start:238 stop:552 length:315 start_codon:yes stop_codon:yes gene_type:complete
MSRSQTEEVKPQLTRQSNAAKAHKQSLRQNLRNSAAKSLIKTYIKKLLLLVRAKDHVASIKAFAGVQSVLFKGAKKNVIKFNKAVRIASRLNKRIKTLESRTVV